MITETPFQTALAAAQSSLDRPLTEADYSAASEALRLDKAGRPPLASKHSLDLMSCGATRQWRHGTYCAGAGRPWAAAWHRTAAAALTLPALTTAVPAGIYSRVANPAPKPRSAAATLEHRIAADVGTLVGCLQRPSVPDAVLQGATLGTLWTEYRQAADTITTLQARCQQTPTVRPANLQPCFRAAKRTLKTHEQALEQALRATDPNPHKPAKKRR